MPTRQMRPGQRLPAPAQTLDDRQLLRLWFQYELKKPFDINAPENYDPVPFMHELAGLSTEVTRFYRQLANEQFYQDFITRARPFIEMPLLVARRPGDIAQLRQLYQQYHRDYHELLWKYSTKLQDLCTRLAPTLSSRETSDLITDARTTALQVIHMVRLLVKPLDDFIELDMAQGTNLVNMVYDLTIEVSDYHAELSGDRGYQDFIGLVTMILRSDHPQPVRVMQAADFYVEKWRDLVHKKLRQYKKRLVDLFVPLAPLMNSTPRSNQRIMTKRYMLETRDRLFYLLDPLDRFEKYIYRQRLDGSEDVKELLAKVEFPEQLISDEQLEGVYRQLALHGATDQDQVD